MNISPNWPKDIQKALKGYASTGDNYQTSSTADIYFFKRKNSPGLFLKINRTEDDPDAPGLQPERIAMDWLHGKLSVPQVLHFHKEETTEYMLTEQIPGTSSHHDCFKNDKFGLVQLLANALQEIHRVPYKGCPLDTRIETQLKEAEHKLKKGILNTEDLPPEWQNRPQELIDHLRNLGPAEDLVFTHGDYCLPNILIQNQRVTGFIDWGYAGIGDPYRDFIAALYSVRRNLGEEWIKPFFEAYGVDSLDPKKKAFYQLLQDLQT
ncbi:MAG: aminoglycoside 3'-phosphotransferase [bacterium]|nr:aminoglycoside 3'-phosphotransferase [bacterium]